MLLDSNARIEDENRNLVALNQEMEGKMASAAEKMDELTDQYLKMKSLVGTRDMKSEEVTMELERKDEEIRRLKLEVRKRDDEADAIFSEVSAKTEQFVTINEEKERENAQLKHKISGLEHRLNLAELAPDKQRINRLEDDLKAASGAFQNSGKSNARSCCGNGTKCRNDEIGNDWCFELNKDDDIGDRYGHHACQGAFCDVKEPFTT